MTTTPTTPTTPTPLTVTGATDDLTIMVGQRCTITTTVGGIRYPHTGLVHRAWHTDGQWTGLGPHAGVLMIEDPHGSCRGGDTALYLGYGDATVVVGS